MYRRGIFYYLISSFFRYINEFKYVLLVLFSLTAVILSIISLNESRKALQKTKRIDIVFEEAVIDNDYLISWIQEEPTDDSPNTLTFRINFKVKNISDQAVTIGKINYTSNGRNYPDDNTLLTEPITQRIIKTPLSINAHLSKSYSIVVKYFIKENNPIRKEVQNIFSETKTPLKTTDFLSIIKQNNLVLFSKNTEKSIILQFYLKENNKYYQKVINIQ